MKLLPTFTPPQVVPSLYKYLIVCCIQIIIKKEISLVTNILPNIFFFCSAEQKEIYTGLKLKGGVKDDRIFIFG